MRHLALFILAVVLVSGCTQSSSSPNIVTIGSSEACGMFTNAGIPSLSCPTPNSKVNNQFYQTSEFCGTSESVDFTHKPYIYFKPEYLNTLDTSDLKTTYCEIVSETAPKVYRYIRANTKITHLFYVSASPCKNYTAYVMPKMTEVFGDFVKSEYLGDMNSEGDTMTLRMTTTPIQISKKGSNIVVYEDAYTCV